MPNDPDPSDTAALQLVRTMYHEAGHAVAARFLGIPIKGISVIRTEDTLGDVELRPLSKREIEELETADYESSYGGFVNARTRRWVEARIMVALAGGVVEEHFVPGTDASAGQGVVPLTPEQIDALVADHPHLAGVTQRLVDGDLQTALNFAEKISGGQEEAEAYLKWLQARSENLVTQPNFLASVEAVVNALVEPRKLSGHEVARVIASANEERHRDAMQRFREQRSDNV